MSEPSECYCFLDVDGVLNSFAAYGWGDAPRALIEPQCVRAFNRIIEETAAKIVLSSSWRHYVLGGAMTLLGFEHLLRSHGVRGSLVATTCHDEEADERGEQIRLWRRQNAPGCRYVVLDDFDDGISERGLNFVRVNGSVGLTEGDAERAIEMLRG